MHRGQTYLTATHSQLRYFCYFFLISRRDGENNGLLPVVPLLPPRSCVVSRPNSLPLPFRTPVACVAGVWRGREREFWASEKREGLSRAPRVSLAPKTWAKGHISHDAWRLISVFSSRWKERSRGSREIFNDLNFKMQLIQGKFQ